MSDHPPIPPVSPYLTVDGAIAAISFYKQAFGAEELSRMPTEDGTRLMHAALSINGGLVMLSDDFADMHGGQSGVPSGGRSPVTIHLEVADADVAWERAISAGCDVRMPLADMFWGQRYGRLRDKFGHEWSIGGPLKG